MIKYISTRLLVSDFPACFRFYRDVMGFTSNHGDENGEYASFDTGATDIALYRWQDMAREIGQAEVPSRAVTECKALLCFEVDDVDETYRQLRERGTEFAAGLTDHPDWGMRTAHFRDPDGNLIEIFHPLPTQPE
jgi:lactoylglutathione lyase